MANTIFTTIYDVVDNILDFNKYAFVEGQTFFATDIKKFFKDQDGQRRIQVKFESIEIFDGNLTEFYERGTSGFEGEIVVANSPNGFRLYYVDTHGELHLLSNNTNEIIDIVQSSGVGDGSDGLNGFNTFILNFYKVTSKPDIDISTITPPGNVSGEIDFSTGEIEDLTYTGDNVWFTDIADLDGDWTFNTSTSKWELNGVEPAEDVNAPELKIVVSKVLLFSREQEYVFSGLTGDTPSKFRKDGSNQASLFLYQARDDGSKPEFFPDQLIYNFSTKNFEFGGDLKGWNLDLPPVNVENRVIWVIGTAVNSNIIRTVIQSSEWGTGPANIKEFARFAEDGNDSTSFWLIASSDVVKVGENNLYTPTTITFSGKSQTGLGDPINYAGRFRIEESTDGSTWVQRYQSSADESTRVFTPTAQSTSKVLAIRVSLFAAGGTTNLLDQEIIPFLFDGSSTITVLNTNSNITFAGPLSGFSGINFSNGSSNIEVFIGTQKLNFNTTGANTFNVTSLTNTGVTVTGSGSGTTYTLNNPTAMSADSASSVVNITLRNAAAETITTTTTVSYSLSRRGLTGEDGASALSIILSNPTHVFTAANNGAVASYANSGTLISILQGSTLLTYETGTGFPTTNGRFRLVVSSSGITAGAISSDSAGASAAIASGMANPTEVASITFTANIRSQGVNSTLVAVQTFSKSKTGANSTVPGPTGPTAVFKGTYSSSGQYTRTAEQRDVVFSGSTYYILNTFAAVGTSTRVAPPSSIWDVFTFFQYIASELSITEESIVRNNITVGQNQEIIIGAQDNFPPYLSIGQSPQNLGFGRPGIHLGMTPFATNRIEPTLTLSNSFLMNAIIYPGIGGAAATTTSGNFYTVAIPFRLNTVDVYATASGNVTFQLRSGHGTGGTILQSKTFTLNTGKNTLILDMDFPLGNVTLMRTSTGPGLFRVTAGVSYPYITNNASNQEVVRIINSTAGTSQYFWFFNPVIQGTNALSWNGEKLDIIGDIGGSIGNIEIGNLPTNGIRISSDGINAYKSSELTFSLDTVGDAFFEGEIRSSKGKIGGWNLGTDFLDSGGRGFIWAQPSGAEIWLGINAGDVYGGNPPMPSVVGTRFGVGSDALGFYSRTSSTSTESLSMGAWSIDYIASGTVGNQRNLQINSNRRLTLRAATGTGTDAGIYVQGRNLTGDTLLRNPNGTGSLDGATEVSTRVVKKDIEDLDLNKVNEFIEKIEIKKFKYKSDDSTGISLIIEEEQEKDLPYKEELFKKIQGQIVYQNWDDVPEWLQEYEGTPTLTKNYKNEYSFNPKMYNPNVLMALSIAALKEQHKKIQSLEERLEKLEKLLEES